MKTTKTSEQLYNRILINFGIAILAYSGLNILYNTLYMKNWVTFTFAGIFAVLAILCYVFSKQKPLKNYGHMFLAFTLALIFTRLSVITVQIFGYEAFESMQGIYIIKKLLQTRTEVILITWLGAIYLVGMVIYNAILMYKVEKAEKKERRQIKH